MLKRLHSYHHWLFFFPLVVWAIVYGVLGFNGLYGQDAFQYYQFSLAIEQLLRGEPEVYSFQVPPFYPLSGAAFAVFFGHTALFLQLISVVGLVGTTFVISRIIHLLFPETPDKTISGYLFLWLVLSPYLLRGSLSVMTDFFTAFWASLVFYHFLLYQKSQTGFSLAMLTAGAILAFFTRYLVAPLLFVPCLAAVWIMVRNRKFGHIVVGGIVVALFFLVYVYFKRGFTGEFFHHHLQGSWSLANVFRRSFTGPDGDTLYPVINLVNTSYQFFHPVYLFPGFLFMFFVRKQDFQKPEIQLILASVALYSLFVSGLVLQNKRFLILSFLFVIVCYFPAWQHLLGKISGRWLPLLVVASVCLQLGLFAQLFSSFYQINYTERQLYARVAALPPAPLYTFEVRLALESYGLSAPVYDLYYPAPDTFEMGNLLLVNPVRWQPQWENHNPMINTRYILDNYETTVLDQLSGGWTLYRIGRRKVVENLELR
ncbi:MAG: hypothetical protein SF052_03840 [Bacteroidia bacterium]|nr:hypothetical protein [Bacteroidia bacterium]